MSAKVLDSNPTTPQSFSQSGLGPSEKTDNKEIRAQFSSTISSGGSNFTGNAVRKSSSDKVSNHRTIDPEQSSSTSSTTNPSTSTTNPPTSGSSTAPQTSPLLSSTPPIVAKSLIKSYPYLLILNKLLSIFTWTNDDYWVNLIVICIYGFTVLYFEKLVTWAGHLIIVGIITLYAVLNQKIVEETNLHPTLDDVVQALTTTCIKADMLLAPITSLSLNAYDIKRLLFTTVFLTPIYLIISFFVIKPRIILLATGLHILSYHSAYSRVTRKMLWKIKFVRLLCFYLTGLDFSTAKNHSLFAAAFAKVQKNATGNTSKSSSGNSSGGLAGNDGKPVRFTYAIYENQRRWLGIGWTSNLLSYERTPWTDEFLNESSSIESFQLPNAENSNYSFGHQQSSQLVANGANWRWVDKTWRLDLTNDGAITLSNNKRSRTTANPSTDDGYIYYDNVWKKPTTEDSFGKYTRRRRWIRTAELVFNGSGSETASNSINISPTTTNIEDTASTTGVSRTSTTNDVTSTTSSTSKSKKRKSLRFASEEDDIKEINEKIADTKKIEDEQVTLKEPASSLQALESTDLLDSIALDEYNGSVASAVAEIIPKSNVGPTLPPRPTGFDEEKFTQTS
ncbi:hypothetical protein CAAN1_16S02872 [[Candida] anglica]|uniref:Peroxin/Ferlin domain-containing protein n=1 Tax=[Candida] anglica TaxID=148631 RepID=A0ABP0ECV8_9ASCO